LKIHLDPRLPQTDSLPDLRRRLTEYFRAIASQVNAVSEGALHGSYNAATAAPATGTYAKGDFVRNSAPSELGTAGSKYVITGFLCVTAGSPGTFVQCRSLTGN
jgi:hypothetical protein